MNWHRNLTYIIIIILTLLQHTKESVAQRVDTPYRFQYKQLIVPAALTSVGLVINGNQPNSIKNQIKDYRNTHWSGFHTKADDYIAFAPAVIAYGLEWTPYKSRTNIYDKTAIYAKSQLINFGLTTSLKHLIGQPRPDGSNNLSMPSGHTSLAFSNATFLAMEYRQSLPWMPFVAYGLAGSVGLMRIANNKHYLSDVLVGAAIGILSTKLTYWTHQYRWQQFFQSKRRLVTTKP